VARGALYHHFPGKDALFRAVFEAVQADTASRVVAAAFAVPDPWGAAHAALSAFLDACLEPQFRQIVVMDSVQVLAKDMLEGGVEHIDLPMLRNVLTPLVDTFLPGLDVEALVHVALGGLFGAALYIARSPEPTLARVQADAVINAIIGGLPARMEPQQ
jgi:AcrR family transcriptional regulator